MSVQLNPPNQPKFDFDATRNKDHFKSLTPGQKFLVGLATAAISLVTLGIAGLPMYNYVTDVLTNKNITRMNPTQGTGPANVTAAKTQQYVAGLRMFFGNSKVLVDSPEVSPSLKDEKDTAFKLLAKKAEMQVDYMLDQLKENIDESGHKSTIYNRNFPLGDNRISPDVFARYLVDENLPETLKLELGNAGDEFCAEIQEKVNMERFLLAANLFNLKVTIHKVSIQDEEGIGDAAIQNNFNEGPANLTSQLKINPAGDPLIYNPDGRGSLEVVLGKITHETVEGTVYKREDMFLQPREIQ